MENLAAGASFDSIIQKTNALIVNPIIIVLFSFALVGFLWGVRGYITNADDSEARQKGAEHMLWGVIGMMIMVSTFAIMRLVLQTFGLYPDATKSVVEKVIPGGN